MTAQATDPAPQSATEPAAVARRLARATATSVLSTLDAESGAPYGSLVLAACEPDASPVLLLSQLAQHNKNLERDARASLLFDGTAGLEDPLTGPRATVDGRLSPTDDPMARRRFLARHPAAERYAGFADFAVYRMAVDRVHLVAGFGKIDWIAAADFLCDASGATALAAAEPDIVAHMNEDHANALRLYATRLLGLPDGEWRMTGIDPEGIDLRAGGRAARLSFDAIVADAAGARKQLVALAAAARNAAA